MTRLSLFAVSWVLILTLSCKNPTSTSSNPDVVMDVPDGFSTTGIDPNTMNMMLEKGDHIDYIFNSIPLSMNQDGRAAFYQEMRYVSNQAVAGIPENCKPMARKVYLGAGEIIMESDLYFTNDCAFQIFILDEKPLFGNTLSQEGITFYTNLMRSAQATMPEDMRTDYVIPQGRGSG